MTENRPANRKEFMANFLDAPKNNGTTRGATDVQLGDDSAKYMLLLLCHGILLFSAWCVAAPVGVMVARNLKQDLGHWWFRLHMGLGVFILVGSLGGAAGMLIANVFSKHQYKSMNI